MLSNTISSDVVPIEDRFLSINGKVISCLEGATISVFDTSFHRGDGVFEVMRVVTSIDSRGATTTNIRCLDQHMKRLQTSAKTAGCPLPPEDILRRWLNDAVSTASGSNSSNRSGCFRLIATKGNSEYHQKPSVMIFWFPLPCWPATFTLYPILAPWHPAGLPGWETPIKWTSYGPNVVSSNMANEAGYTDALLLSPHRVERPVPPHTWSDVDLQSFHVLDGSNFAIAFVEESRDVDETTLTSKPILHMPCDESLGLLPSITQTRLAEIARENKGLVVKKNVYTLGQLLEKADEVLVMSTTRGVKTVTRIGEYEIPYQRPSRKEKQPVSWATIFSQLLEEYV
jgi:branched-subunit amino acid aminotransferase/4-amino-4-deoxychorismate lyase